MKAARLGLPLVLAAFVAACSSPEMAVRTVFGRGVTVENTGDAAFTIERIIANDSRENGNCNHYPNRTLAPGESYTATFLLCGTVQHVSVVTDQGTWHGEGR